MPRRRTGGASRRTYKRRRLPGKRLQRVRKLAGQRPVTFIEQIAGYGGKIGNVADAVSKIYGLVNSEAKYLDTSLAGAINNTPNYLVRLCGIAEGDDVSQRNGRMILSKSIQLKMTVVLPTTQTVPTVIGIALIMDKKSSIGIANGWTDVFATSDANALINKGDSDRFVILKRWTFTLTNGVSQSREIKYFMSLKGIHIKYNGTGSTNLDQNDLFLVATAPAAANQPTTVGNARYEWYDN